jgi:ankyrin repeat protein
VINSARKKRNNATSVKLCTACAKGDLRQVRRMLTSHSLDVNRGDYDRRTPLHIAAGRGHTAVVELLIASLADVNLRDRSHRTPLFESVLNGQDATAAILELHGAELLADRLTESLCAAAAKGDSLEEMRYLLKGSEREIAVLADQNGRTPLHIAAAAGHHQHVKLLIEAKANVNAIDAYGGTPLQDAFHNGHAACSEVLLKSKAAMGKTFDAAFALCEAAAADDVDTLLRLIEHKCDVDTEDFDGRTALHIAAANHRLAACTFLVKQEGVNVNHEDRHGDTAVDDARRTRTELAPVIEDLMRAFGGKEGSHTHRPSSERSLAEQNRAIMGIAEVETMRALLVMSKRATSWVEAQAKATRSLTNEANAALRIEEERGQVLADSRPGFLIAISNYAEDQSQRVDFLAGTLQPLVAKWQEQNDQYSTLKQELARQLASILSQMGLVRPVINSLLEVQFREPAALATGVVGDSS